jgi:hypothetical protein
VDGVMVKRHRNAEREPVVGQRLRPPGIGRARTGPASFWNVHNALVDGLGSLSVHAQKRYDPRLSVSWEIALPHRTAGIKGGHHA